MVLTSRGGGSHNAMLGRRIPHPASTNFEGDSNPHPAKRLKLIDNTENEPDAPIGDLEDESETQSLRSISDEIRDSEEDYDLDEDEEPKGQGITELESALAPVKTDKEAIAEYETMKFDEKIGLDISKSRFVERESTKPRTSIYVDAFNLALDTVLEDEGHLFDEKEQEVFEQWRALEYEQQYLYVRLFLRKASTWHRVNRLRYYSDVADMPAAVSSLQQTRILPESTALVHMTPGELESPVGMALGGSFCFAESSEEMITTLEEASSLLSLDELKVLAKDARVSGKNKSELLKAFRRTSGRQAGLGYVGLKRSDSEQTIVSEGGDDEAESDAPDNDGLLDNNRDSHFLRKICAITGPCIRLSLPALKLFERVHLVFYRSTEWTDKSLTIIILARISRRNFPAYVVSRSTNIFLSRSSLLEFEASIRTQYRIDFILEMSGNPGRAGLEEVLTIFEAVYPRWQILLTHEQSKEDREYESGEGAYLRRFSPAWVYTRIVHKGVYVLGRFKKHLREHSILCELLRQNLFHAARRGAWYQRKALLEEHYMYLLAPSSTIPSNAIEQQKKYWKRISLSTCEFGLQDPSCHLIYHHDLQKRIRKLEKSLKIPKREQHDFGHVLLSKPREVSVEGIQIKKIYPTATTIRRRSGMLIERPRSTKTIWVDEHETSGECSVEEMVLSHYRHVLGYKGYHSEGGILRTLFALLFYDILFLYLPNVFQTEYQTCPLDLHTDAFYASRMSEINHRLVQIGNGDAARLIKMVWREQEERKTATIGLNWDFALEDLLAIAHCFEGQALAAVCRVLAQEYRLRGGGIPDLFLWKMEEGEEEDEEEDVNVNVNDQERKHGPANVKRKGEVRFVEVKSENDRLSETQKLWIHVLVGAGIKVELCNAVAREIKEVIVEK